MTISANQIDLTTVAAAQAYAQTQQNSLTATADQYQTLITAVSQWAATFCSRSFVLQSYNETRNGRGTRQLFLKNRPVQSVQSLAINGVSASLAATAPWANGYRFDTKSIYGYDSVFFCDGLQNIVVAYTAGYVTPGMNVLDPTTYPTVTLPADIQQACNEAVADRFARRSNIGIKARTLASETVTYTDDAIPTSAMATFRYYQSKVIPL